MTQDSRTVKCKYFNNGYCKFEERCAKNHPKTICLLALCKDKKCPKRHPRACWFKAHCRRRSSCLYRHSKYESVNIEEEIDRLNEEIKQLHEVNKEKNNLLKECEELKTQNFILNKRYNKL